MPTIATPGPLSNLRQALGYRKFYKETLKVVVLDSGYHLQGECVRSLRQIGHTTRSIEIKSEQSFTTILTTVLRTISAFKPDFVLSINHLGFDRDGALASILHDVQMPLAVWYVDSPMFVLRAASVPAPDITSVFLWEEAYAPALRKAGAEDVIYLPLAADERFLRHRASDRTSHYPALFVGDSMQQAEAKWRGRVSAESMALCRKWEAQLLCDRAAMQRLATVECCAHTGSWDALALATFRATGRYRRQVLAMVPKDMLHIVGDEGWRRRLPSAHLMPPVHYGSALAEMFQMADVNINATSLQMPSAVNQRVFDVPASGGFLLSDAQSDMYRHFVWPRDAKLFNCPDEARDLLAFYTTKPALREAITQSLREQILQRHTYAHRLTDMVSHMRARHRAGLSLNREPRLCAHPSPSSCPTTETSAPSSRA